MAIDTSKHTAAGLLAAVTKLRETGLDYAHAKAEALKMPAFAPRAGNWYSTGRDRIRIDSIEGGRVFLTIFLASGVRERTNEISLAVLLDEIGDKILPCAPFSAKGDAR